MVKGKCLPVCFGVLYLHSGHSSYIVHMEISVTSGGAEAYDQGEMPTLLVNHNNKCLTFPLQIHGRMHTLKPLNLEKILLKYAALKLPCIKYKDSLCITCRQCTEYLHYIKTTK